MIKTNLLWSTSCFSKNFVVNEVVEKKEFYAEAPLSNPYFTPCLKTYDFLCFDIILVSVFLIVCCFQFLKTKDSRQPNLTTCINQKKHKCCVNFCCYLNSVAALSVHDGRTFYNAFWFWDGRDKDWVTDWIKSFSFINQAPLNVQKVDNTIYWTNLLAIQPRQERKLVSINTYPRWIVIKIIRFFDVLSNDWAT